MLSFVASLVICSQGKQDSVAFPLDYYTADEIAKAISTPEVAYSASAELANKVYLVSLTRAPVGKQLKLLCSGLDLKVDQHDSKAKLVSDQTKLRSSKKLRRQIIENLLGECSKRQDFLSEIRAGSSPPLKFEPLSGWGNWESEERDLLARNLYDQALFDLTEQTSLPEPDAFDESDETTTAYPRSALPVQFAARLDQIIIGPPVLGFLSGVQLRFNSDGPMISPVAGLLTKSSPEEVSELIYVRSEEPDDRTQIVNRIFRGNGTANWWSNPGLPVKDQGDLPNREAETSKIVSSIDSDIAQVASREDSSFSFSLGQLCARAKLDVLYEVDTPDERLGNAPEPGKPMGFKELFGEQAGYTATLKNGLLVVKDELAFLQHKAPPVASLIKVLRRKHPDESLFHLPYDDPSLTLHFNDYKAILEESGDTGDASDWDPNIAKKALPGNANRDCLSASALVVPIFKTFKSSEIRQMIIEGKDRRFRDFSTLPELANESFNVIRSSKRGREAFLSQLKLDYIDCSINQDSSGYGLLAIFGFRDNEGKVDQLMVPSKVYLPDNDPFFSLPLKKS